MSDFAGYFVYVAAPMIVGGWLIAWKMPFFQHLPNERRFRVRLGWFFTAFILGFSGLLFLGLRFG